MNAARKWTTIALLGFMVLVIGLLMILEIVVLAPLSPPPTCVSYALGFCGLYNDTAGLLLTMVGYLLAFIAGIALLSSHGARPDNQVVTPHSPTQKFILVFGICMILSFQASLSPAVGDVESLFWAGMGDVGVAAIESHWAPENYGLVEALIAFATVSIPEKLGLEPWPGWGAGARKPKERRSHRDLHAAILRVSVSNNVTANQLILHLNLNSKLARGCLTELLDRGFIEARKEKKFTTYSATPRGINWLDLYLQLVKIEKDLLVQSY